MKTTASRVREHISGLLSEFTPAEVTRDLELPHGGVVRDVLKDMALRGEVKRMESGRYRYLGFQPAWGARRSIKPRMYRAMHVKRAFTAADIAMLADAGMNFTSKVIRQLLDEDDIERVGKKRNRNNQPIWIYRVRHLDRFYQKYVAAQRSGKEGGS